MTGPNEDGKDTFPTAEMLANRVVEMQGPVAGMIIEDTRAAQTFLALTRALAALQAEQPKPERVRCWKVSSTIHTSHQEAIQHAQDICTVVIIPGWFIADEGPRHD